MPDFKQNGQNQRFAIYWTVSFWAVVILLVASSCSSSTASMPTPGPTQVSERDGMVQVTIPAGTFQMGETTSRGLAECQLLFEPFTDETCNQDLFKHEEPVHSVTLDAFWMDRTEVTNAQYALCAAGGACTPPEYTGSYSLTSYYGDAAYDDYPVIFVNSMDAAAYCAWAGRRLPTEAEWEYAARGGLADGLYPWGDTFDGTKANFCDVNCASSYAHPDYDDGFAETAPVGSYAANGYGLYDMAGNVWEWVNDWYSSMYYSITPAINPTGPASGDYLVMRGGSWFNNGHALRVAYRYGFELYLADTVGFRCADTPGR
jgi:formylglycine-generating enzyme required for sulfatase activity